METLPSLIEPIFISPLVDAAFIASVAKIEISPLVDFIFPPLISFKLISPLVVRIVLSFLFKGIFTIISPLVSVRLNNKLFSFGTLRTTFDYNNKNQNRKLNHFDLTLKHFEIHYQ